jgi:hypothetical protein
MTWNGDWNRSRTDGKDRRIVMPGGILEIGLAKYKEEG